MEDNWMAGESHDPVTVDDLLAAARARLARLSPGEALAAMRAGAAIVDIRGGATRSSR
jgi:hypothetical protein